MKVTALLRLAAAELRHAAHVWLGTSAVAAAFGYAGGWWAALEHTAGLYPGGTGMMLNSAAQSILLFSSVAAVGMLAATANLTVARQRRTYVLWQLVNVRPGAVWTVVLVQLALVALAGSAVGFVLAAVTAPALFPVSLGTLGQFKDVMLRASISQLPTVVSLCAALILLGGMRAARTACRVSPLEALREVERGHHRLPLVRILVLVAVCAGLWWAADSLMDGVAAGFYEGASNAMLAIPVAMTALAACVAPLVLPMLLRVWSSLLTWRTGLALPLARAGARSSLAEAVSVELPIMVCGGLVGGVYSLFGLAERYWAFYRLPVGSGFEIAPALGVMLFGGPVVICAVGACASVIMSGGSRGRSVTLLAAVGASPRLNVVVAALEALMHTMNALMAGVFVALASNVVIGVCSGLPLVDGIATLSAVPCLIVAGAGFAVVLAAVLVPTIRSVRRPVADGLRAR